MLCRLTPHEEWVLKNATQYVCCVFRGRGKYDRKEFSTWEQARAAAPGMYEDRGVLIYATFRTHQALIETIGDEVKTMNEFHLVTHKGPAGTPVVRAFQTDELLASAFAKHPDEGVPVRRADDLSAFSKVELVDIYNHIRVGKPLTAFANKEAGISRVWDVLSGAASSEAAQTTTEEGQMATAAAKKTVTRGAKLAPAKTAKAKAPAKAKVAKTPKAKREKGELFPLRAGSKMELLWEALSVKGGATAEDMRKATGWLEARGTAKRLAAAAGKSLETVKKDGEPTRYVLKAIA